MSGISQSITIKQHYWMLWVKWHFGQVACSHWPILCNAMVSYITYRRCNWRISYLAEQPISSMVTTIKWKRLKRTLCGIRRSALDGSAACRLWISPTGTGGRCCLSGDRLYFSLRCFPLANRWSCVASFTHENLDYTNWRANTTTSSAR